MSITTYCAWALEAEASEDGQDQRVIRAAAASHQRCSGISNGGPCACVCHGPRPQETSPMPADNEHADLTPKGRREWPEDAKREVLDAYIAAAVGTKVAVLRHYGVSQSMLSRWANQLEVDIRGDRGGARPGSGPAPAQYDGDSVELDVEEYSGELVSIALADGDRDILDALAFLARVDGADAFVADLVNDVIEAHRDSDQVTTLIALRQEHSAA